VSLVLRELAPTASGERDFLDLLAWTYREGIATQIILYDRGDLDRLLLMTKAGYLPPAGWSVLAVLGRYASGQRSSPKDLLAFLDDGTFPIAPWMVCAFGPDEIRCLITGALFGGDVRTGFENNLCLPDGSIAPDNAEMMGTVAAAALNLNIQLCDADAVRARWLPPA